MIPLDFSAMRNRASEADKWRAKAELLATGMDPETLQQLATIAERMVKMAGDMAAAYPYATPGGILAGLFSVMHHMTPQKQYTTEEINRIYESLNAEVKTP